MKQAQITIKEARYQIERLDFSLEDKIGILAAHGISEEIVRSIQNEIDFENIQKIKQYWNQSNVSRCAEKIEEYDKTEVQN